MGGGWIGCGDGGWIGGWCVGGVHCQQQQVWMVWWMAPWLAVVVVVWNKAQDTLVINTTTPCARHGCCGVDVVFGD